MGEGSGLRKRVGGSWGGVEWVDRSAGSRKGAQERLKKKVKEPGFCGADQYEEGRGWVGRGGGRGSGRALYQRWSLHGNSGERLEG